MRPQGTEHVEIKEQFIPKRATQSKNKLKIEILQEMKKLKPFDFKNKYLQ
jgi:hypothetical protein